MSTQQSSADAGADEALLRLQAAGFTPWTGRRPEELKGQNLEYLLGGGRIIAARSIPPQERGGAMLTVALQGHTYRHRLTGRKLMAMSTGGVVEAYEMDESRPWPLTEKTWAHAEHLEPLPMTYFGGAVPQEVAS